MNAFAIGFVILDSDTNSIEFINTFIKKLLNFSKFGDFAELEMQIGNLYKMSFDV